MPILKRGLRTRQNIVGGSVRKNGKPKLFRTNPGARVKVLGKTKNAINKALRELKQQK